MNDSTQASRTFGELKESFEKLFPGYEFAPSEPARPESLAERIYKKNFVENELAQMLMAANNRIINVTFGIKGHSDETVYVTMENGYGYEINVGADGLMAIASDVTGFMKFK